ncbi:aspartic peptidase domain-containing protein [Mycena floridula]|nr:aspartic peptidase domain-containing protein [Mycena floridula]
MSFVFAVLFCFVLPSVPSTALPQVYRGHSIPLARRAYQENSVNSVIGIVDPQIIANDNKRTISKYQPAQSYMQGDYDPSMDLTLILNNVTCNAASNSIPVFSADALDEPVLILTSQETENIPAVVTVTNNAPLTDWFEQGEDILYYGFIDIGSPPQRFSVDIDTGSADTWIPGPNCKGRENRYDPWSSDNFQSDNRPFRVEYGMGKVSGKLAKDSMTMGGLTAENQTFGMARSMSDELFDAPCDGLIGFGFGTIANCKKPTFFENLIKQGLLLKPFFSIYLTRGEETGSMLTLGGWDETYVKNAQGITWIPLISHTYWVVEMTALVAGTVRTNVDWHAHQAIDSGTTFMYGPEDMVKSFYESIPGSKPWNEGSYTFPCDFNLPIFLSFNGIDFSVDMDDFNLGCTEEGSNDCVGALQAFSSSNGLPPNLAVIGCSFLKSWYSTYDYSNGGRVGFSRSIISNDN